MKIDTTRDSQMLFPSYVRLLLVTKKVKIPSRNRRGRMFWVELGLY